MALIRAIGRWALTGLVINYIIGGAIFGLPGELSRLLGRASPLAMIAGAIAIGIFMACAAEAAANGLWATHQTRHGRWRASEAL
jgi:amino acid transporter